MCGLTGKGGLGRRKSKTVARIRSILEMLFCDNEDTMIRGLPFLGTFKREIRNGNLKSGPVQHWNLSLPLFALALPACQMGPAWLYRQGWLCFWGSPNL